jgi:hypothetical protein
VDHHHCSYVKLHLVTVITVTTDISINVVQRSGHNNRGYNADTSYCIRQGYVCYSHKHKDDSNTKISTTTATRNHMCILSMDLRQGLSAKKIGGPNKIKWWKCSNQCWMCTVVTKVTYQWEWTNTWTHRNILFLILCNLHEFWTPFDHVSNGF